MDYVKILWMKTKFNLINMQHLSLVDLQEIITFDR